MRWFSYQVLLLLSCSAFALSQPTTTTRAASLSSPASGVLPRSHLARSPTQRPTTAPTASTSSEEGAESDASKRSGLTPIAIMFIVLGSLALVGMVVALTRFIIAFRRAPKRDRKADEADREVLQQEVTAYQRYSLLGRPVNFEPAPVYRPPPPSYDIQKESTIRESTYKGDGEFGEMLWKDYEEGNRRNIVANSWASDASSAPLLPMHNGDRDLPERHT